MTDQVERQRLELEAQRRAQQQEVQRQAEADRQRLAAFYAAERARRE